MRKNGPLSNNAAAAVGGEIRQQIDFGTLFPKFPNRLNRFFQLHLGFVQQLVAALDGLHVLGVESTSAQAFHVDTGSLAGWPATVT